MKIEKEMLMSIIANYINRHSTADGAMAIIALCVSCGWDEPNVNMCGPVNG